MSFHINPETGVVSRCRAMSMDGCPFSGEESNENHYDSISDARAGYEESMSKHTLVSHSSKPKSQASEVVARFEDKLDHLSQKYNHANYEMESAEKTVLTIDSGFSDIDKARNLEKKGGPESTKEVNALAQSALDKYVSTLTEKSGSDEYSRYPNAEYPDLDTLEKKMTDHHQKSYGEFLAKNREAIAISDEASKVRKELNQLERVKARSS